MPEDNTPVSDDELALAELVALVQVPGALRIITNEVRPDLRQDPDDPNSKLPEDADPDLLLRPDTFVQHHVTRLEVRAHLGAVRAHSAEGDWTEGRPAAVLRRLREWRR